MNQPSLCCNGNVRDFFRTTVGMRQGCTLSLVLFNLFLEKIMQKTLSSQHPSENDCFAACYLLGGIEEELRQLTERLEKTAVSYGIEIS